MKKKIIIRIAFNSLGFTKERFTQKWIDYRIDLFTKYTLQSLKAQTNQDYLALLSCREETLPLIYTSLSRYEKLPSNVKFVSMKEIDEIIGKESKAYDYVYLVRIDSDDMYHKTYVEQMHNYEHQKETEVIINQNGYLYNILNNQLVPIHYGSPQFYTLIYKPDDFINGKRYHLPGGHVAVIKLKHEIISKRNFLNIIHSKNTSPKKISHKELVIEENEVNKILREFGM